MTCSGLVLLRMPSKAPDAICNLQLYKRHGGALSTTLQGVARISLLALTHGRDWTTILGMSWNSRPLRATVSSRGMAWLDSVFWLLLVLLGLVLAWRGIAQLAVLFGWPYPTDGLEGTLLHEARLLRAGQPLYQPLALDRFVSAPYPPLHPLLLAFVDQWHGPHIFWSGRLISLVSAAVASVTIGLLVARVSGSRLAGVLGASLFLAAPPVIIWAARIKPDMFGLMWTALGLYLATWCLRDPPPTTSPLRQLALLGTLVACFVLAFFTKQTMVLAPLAVGVAFAISDLADWRAARHSAIAGRQRLPAPRRLDRFIGRLPLRWRTLLFTVAYLGLVLGIWALLDLSTHGEYSLHVWWNGQRSQWWSEVLLLKMVGLLRDYVPLLFLGVGIVLIARRNRLALVPACYFLLAPLSLLAASETGSHHNHLLETVLAACIAGAIVAGTVLDRLMRPNRLSQAPASTPGWLLGLVGALLVAQLAQSFTTNPWYGSELTPDPKDTPQRYIDFIRTTPGEILADDPALPLMAGKAIRFDDPSTQGPAAAIGIWDQRGMLADITNQRFSAIMIPVDVDEETFDHAGRWTPEMIAAIRANYRVLYHDQIVTYVPK